MDDLIEMLNLSDVVSDVPEGLRSSADNCSSPCCECSSCFD